MKVVLYTTGCPKCRVLTKKLDSKNIEYEKVTDVEVMESKGFVVMPMLEVDGKIMSFGEAVKWVNEYDFKRI